MSSRAWSSAAPVLAGRVRRSDASARRSRKARAAIPRGESGLCDPRRSHATTGASVRVAHVVHPHPYSPRPGGKRVYEPRALSRVAQSDSNRQYRRCACCRWQPQGLSYAAAPRHGSRPARLLVSPRPRLPSFIEAAHRTNGPGAPRTDIANVRYRMPPRADLTVIDESPSRSPPAERGAAQRRYRGARV